jgi:hypothetical protein
LEMLAVSMWLGQDLKKACFHMIIPATITGTLVGSSMVILPMSQ